MILILNFICDQNKEHDNKVELKDELVSFIFYSNNIIKNMQTSVEVVYLPYFYILMAFSIAYAIYYYLFAYFIVKWDSKSANLTRNLGKTLPPYPNGWYIACKSNQLAPGQVKSIDIAGQNIALLRSTKGDVHALYAYCSHLGANMGIGGKVVNDDCIECPFHGWLYDGKTGQCVDHDNKVVMSKTLQYDDEFGRQQCKKVTWKEGNAIATQRKYPVKQRNTFIYIWIHSNPLQEPQFDILDTSPWMKQYSNRGQTIHNINCVLQDIPQNGADIFHFKYIHRYLLAGPKLFEVTWHPSWKRGDDPNLHELFEHKKQNIKQFKQNIYNKIVKNIPEKKYYSFGTVDNYLNVPLIGQIFLFNITIIQTGPTLVNIFLKTPIFQLVFAQYIQPQGKNRQKLVHELFVSSYLPYWFTSILLYAQGLQVYYDMIVWNNKKFGYKLHLKQNQADKFLQSWREWFSQHYQGCDSQLKSKQSIDW